MQRKKTKGTMQQNHKVYQIEAKGEKSYRAALSIIYYLYKALNPLIFDSPALFDDPRSPKLYNPSSSSTSSKSLVSGRLSR